MSKRGVVFLLRCVFAPFPLCRLPKGSGDTSRTSFPSRRARNWPRNLYRESTTNRGTLDGREGKKKKTYTQNFQQKQAATVNPPIEMNKEQQRFSRPPVIPRLLTWLEMLPSLRRVSPTWPDGWGRLVRNLSHTGFNLRNCDLWPTFLFVLERDRREREQERLAVLDPGSLGLLYASHHSDRNNTTPLPCPQLSTGNLGMLGWLTWCFLLVGAYLTLDQYSV